MNKWYKKSQNRSAKQFWDLLCLIVCHDVLPFAYRYGCVGLRIWLRGVKNMTALGYGYDSVGLRIRLRRLTETYPSACRDICVS